MIGAIVPMPDPAPRAMWSEAYHDRLLTVVAEHLVSEWTSYALAHPNSGIPDNKLFRHIRLDTTRTALVCIAVDT